MKPAAWPGRVHAARALGRVAEGGLRELVISRGRSGYVALYRFDANTDRVFILAVCHQRELSAD